MAGEPDEAVCAINLLSLRPGVAMQEFQRFSSELDQPICLAQDVVRGFDAYAITSRGPGAPHIDVIEVMRVSSWSEWERVRDGLDALKPVTEAFDALVMGDTVRTVFATRIPPRR